jgi:hypothetical protein
MPKIGEVEANDVRCSISDSEAHCLFEAGQADAECIESAFFFSKGTTPRRKAIDEGFTWAVHAGRPS